MPYHEKRMVATWSSPPSNVSFWAYALLANNVVASRVMTSDHGPFTAGIGLWSGQASLYAGVLSG
jgi:hypothetical protein